MSSFLLLAVQITISYEIKTRSLLLFLMKRFYHSDLKAHIYRQENSAQQANTFKINRKKLALGEKPKKQDVGCG